jgi:hypothetical protein
LFSHNIKTEKITVHAAENGHRKKITRENEFKNETLMRKKETP